MSDARAGCLTLERVDWVEVSCFDFSNHFFTFSSLSYFFINTIVEPLTLELYLLSRFCSNRSDLLIFGLYKKVVDRQGLHFNLKISGFGARWVLSSSPLGLRI